MDESSDGVLARQRVEGVSHGGRCDLKFTLIPVCCVYESITKLINPKFCVSCGRYWNESI